MENNIHKNKKHSCWWGCCGCNTRRGGLGWGVFYLVLGGYFLLQELGYIVYDISTWTIILVALGLYLIVRSLSR